VENEMVKSEDEESTISNLYRRYIMSESPKKGRETLI
jgi:hypothetical protein